MAAGPAFGNRGGMTAVASIAQRAVLTVPEEEAKALSDDIGAQLARLPLTIPDTDTYRLAKESLPLLKRAEDTVVAFFKDIKAAANAAHKAITSKEAAQLKPITDARTRVSGLIYAFEQEQDRLRRERERKVAEDEKRRRETDALEQAAALAHDSPEMAEQIVDEAIAAPAPVVVLPSTSLDVAGVSTRENWQFVYAGGSAGQKWKDLTDEQRKRVLQFIPRDYLMPDEAAIGKVVKAMKSGTKIPGVQAYDAGTIVVRG